MKTKNKEGCYQKTVTGLDFLSCVDILNLRHMLTKEDEKYNGFLKIVCYSIMGYINEIVYRNM